MSAIISSHTPNLCLWRLTQWWVWVHRHAILSYFGDPIMMNLTNLDAATSHLVQVGLGHDTAHNSVNLPGLVYSWICLLSVAWWVFAGTGSFFASLRGESRWHFFNENAFSFWELWKRDRIKPSRLFLLRGRQYVTLYVAQLPGSLKMPGEALDCRQMERGEWGIIIKLQIA